MKKLFTVLFLFALTPFVWSQQLHVVETVGNTAFSPTDITIALGDTVRWVNTGGGHNVNATQADYPDNPESFGNAVGVGWTFDHVFTIPGFYNYHCDPHLGLGMVGTVSVLNGPAYPIGLVTGDSNADGEADSVGVACNLTGVVHGIDMDGNAGLSFTIIDAAGDGIGVFNFNDVSNYVVTEGDEVIIEGTIGSFNGLAQINPDSIIVNSTGNALATATVVTALDESTESQLITLQNVTLVDPTQWDNAGSNNITVTDGTNNWTVRIDSDVVDLNAAPAPTGAFNITGIGGQFDNSGAPFDAGYQLLPRYLSDLENIVVAGVCDIGTVTADSDMNGEADSVGVDCSVTGVVYGIDLDGNAGISFTIIDAAGNGINVFNFADVSNYVVAEGDEITVEGEIGSFNGLAQIFADSIILNSSGNALMASTIVTDLDESTESQLITLQNVTLVDPTQWDNAGSNNIDVTDGTSTWTVRIDSDVVDLNAAPAPTVPFNITGIGGQFDNSGAPFDAGYQLLPRYLADLDLIMPSNAALVITGVFDPQPAPGAGPKGIELYALQDIPDLSIYGIGSANNGTGSSGSEFTFPADAITAGSCITLTDTASLASFMAFFGTDPTYQISGGGANAINGDDAIELFENGMVIDVFGQIDVDGSGTPWEYLDGWAYRKNATGPDGSSFIQSNWIYSGVDALQDGTFTMNSEFANPFPICTYTPMAAANITANDDNVNLPVDATTTIDILANDETPNGVMTITIVTMPTGGTVAVNGTTDVAYTSTGGFCGADSFVYEICDGSGCSQATVSITIECPPSYPAYAIGLVTGDSDGNFVPDSLGVLCEVTGVVHNPDFRGGSGYTFTIIGANGDGIAVFEFDDVSGYTNPTEGDELTLRGEIGQFNGLNQFRPAEIVVNSSGNALVTPTDVMTLGEETESQFIKMYNMELVDPTQWLGGGASFNVDITDGTNTFSMRIDNDSELSVAPAIVGIFNVTGIGGQFDDEDPRDSGYQIFPRYNSDIEEVISTVNPALAEKITLQPNPVSDVLQIRSEIQLDQIRVTNMLGQQIALMNQPNLNETINVNNWQSGIYVVTFVTGDYIWTSQFVKQ